MPTAIEDATPAAEFNELPLLQETINGRCTGGAIKECHVWGGNKFRKGYEYCACREL